LKNIPAKFHPNPIEMTELRFFEEVAPTRRKQQQKEIE